MTYSGYYSLGGATKPPGAATIGTATVMSELSVSAPTLGFNNGGYNEAWFKLGSTASGKLIFDATLSYNLEDPSTSSQVELTLFQGPEGAGSLGSLTLLDTESSGVNDQGFSVARGQVTWDVVEHTFYFIRLRRSSAAFTTALILRISDYAMPTPWGSLPDQQWVIVPPDGPTYSSDLPSPGLLSNTNQPWHIPDYLISGGGLGTLGIGHCQKWDRGFLGYYQMSQSFGGPRPGDATEVAAWNCTWAWARKGNWSGQWWSAHPAGDSGFVDYSWNGTDPYDDSIPGFGTCLVHSGEVDSRDSINTGTVYIAYGSDAGGAFQPAFEHFQSQNPCQRLKVSQIPLQAGEAAGGEYPTPPDGMEDAVLEWEDPTCTLTGLDAASDEILLANRSEPDDDNGTPDFEVRWYLRAVPLDENTAQAWGPDRANDTWVGDDSGPGTMYYDKALPPYSGGSTGWTPIGLGTILDAMYYEAHGAEAGLRAVAVSPTQLDDTVPTVILPNGTPPENKEAFRRSLVSFRAHLRPSRYRWVPAPVLPPVDGKVSSITGLPDLNRRVFAP